MTPEAVVPTAALPPARTVWPSVVVLLLAFIGTLIGSCFAAVFAGFMMASSGATFDPLKFITDPIFLFLSVVATQVSMFVCVRFLPRLLKDEHEGWVARVRWNPEHFSVIDLIITTVGCIAAGTAAMAVMRFTALESLTLKLFEDAARSMNDGAFALLLLFGSLGAGFVEELTFRGLLQTRLVQTRGPVVGIVVTAFVFGLWHADVVHTPVAMGLGLWLGWCAHRQQTIVTVALAHTLNNLTSFLASRATTGDTEPPPLYGLIGGVAVLSVCAALMHVRRRPRAEVVPP